MDLNTYLFFDGQCEAAFTLYEKVLGGKIMVMARYSDAPPGQPVPKEKANQIMHACLWIGNHRLMASDVPHEDRPPMQGFSVALTVTDPAEAERIFHRLAEGGTVTMPMAETFWALRFAMLKDKFGTPWMINCEKPTAAGGDKA